MARLKAEPESMGRSRAVRDLPLQHREQLVELSQDAENLDRSIADHIAGAVVRERKNTVNLWIFKIINNSRTMSYRAREAVLLGNEEQSLDSAEWVTVNAKTTLRHVLKEYGDRLLGYDAMHEEAVIEILACDLFEASSKNVRILVRKAAVAAGR